MGIKGYERGEVGLVQEHWNKRRGEVILVGKSNAVIQTEAERRRREAGVKQSMEIRVRSCMWVGMYGIWNYLAN